MTERDAQDTLCDKGLVGDTYRSSENGSATKAGRGSEYPAPGVVVVSRNAGVYLLHTKTIPVPGFTGTALTRLCESCTNPP